MLISLTDYLAPWPISGKTESRKLNKNETHALIMEVERTNFAHDKVGKTSRDTAPNSLEQISKRLTDYNYVVNCFNSESYRNSFNMIF